MRDKRKTGLEPAGSTMRWVVQQALDRAIADGRPPVKATLQDLRDNGYDVPHHLLPIAGQETKEGG